MATNADLWQLHAIIGVLTTTTRHHAALTFREDDASA
jgi:hypothetical protein